MLQRNNVEWSINLYWKGGCHFISYNCKSKHVDRVFSLLVPYLGLNECEQRDIRI